MNFTHSSSLPIASSIVPKLLDYVLKVTNDILINMNSQRVSLFVLLDLSAAFDTIDHSILLNRLKYNLGVNGTALSWFDNMQLCWRDSCNSAY